ncbi:alpha-glucosidase [Xanthomonas citri pv. glycines str. 8ra]|nr:alpha-glucosidase [Xanthomonas citri pv. glycines str. 8ra]
MDAIWISPFFKSPMADFGYDIADYRAVDPLFGTLDDFDRLLDKAHALGLKVMIDQVLSHTSIPGGLMSRGRRLLTLIKGGINSIRLDRDLGNLNMQITIPTLLLAEDLVKLIQLPDQLVHKVSGSS